jgi:hypothetical protein
VDLVMSIGPAGEVLRLWGDRVDEIRPKVRSALLEGMADMARGTASTPTPPPGPFAPSLLPPTSCAEQTRAAM